MKLTKTARRKLRNMRLVRIQLTATFKDARGNASGARRGARLGRNR